MANKKLFPLVQELLDDIEKYRAKAGIDRTAFGRQCMNDGNFISRLEQGRIPNVQTFIRVEEFIASKTKAVPRSSSHRRRVNAP